LKLIVFDIKKHEDSLRKLKARKAPPYVLEAYNKGFIEEINRYYRLKLSAIKNKKTLIKESKKLDSKLIKQARQYKHSFMQEALKKRDEDFLKAFFTMTNLDIVSGKKLPPDIGKLIKQGTIKDLSLKDLFKKLR
jgi:hypothetical protein